MARLKDYAIMTGTQLKRERALREKRHKSNKQAKKKE